MSDDSTPSSDATPPPDDGGGHDVRALLTKGDNEVFRRMVASVRDYAIFMLSPEGYIASWNMGAEHIKGYSADEVIGKHFSMFYTPEALAAGWPAEELRRARLHGHLEDEGWRVRKDGTHFWANAIISPLISDSGELLGFSKVTRDLTERREHENRLTESERNLRLLVESVQDYAIFSLDVNGVISSWNLGAQRIKGYAAAEIIGQHFSVFYEPEAVARGWPAEELRRATALGRYEDEGWRVRKDGTRVWANVVITAIRDPRGQLLGFSKVTRDLTERRLHEQAVQDREDNLRLLVEGVRDHAMFLLDSAGRISSWNEGAHKVLGYREDQVLGQDASLLYIPDERLSGQWKADFSSARQSGFLHVEGWRCRSDGTRVWAETSTTLLPDEHGNVRGFVQIVHDLTERRRVETLEDEGRRIGEFIAMLSHELRNPLAPMQHAVAILQRLTQTPDAARCIELMGRQVKHMSRLVDDLLDVSRITSGKIRVELLPLELGTLVHLASEATRSAMEKYEHRFTIDMPPRPIPIQGDATRLTQVVMNLLTNAAKYTPSHGDIHLILTHDGTTATLQLTDNGIGMSEALLRRAFEPFVQGERTLDRSDGGLGIGLTLVKSIVELHGGAVAVASAGLGRGTTFTVTLPLSTARTAVSPVATAVGLSSTSKILVVDDNRDAADSVAVLLRLSGHEVQVAYDGINGLAVARSFTPDVVLLDIGLPGTDGLEVARQIKAIDSLAHARLIAMTGYGQDKDRQASTDAGFALHLTKPVDADTLIKAIRP